MTIPSLLRRAGWLLAGAAAATAVGWALWFGLAWVHYGHAGPGSGGALVEQLMPDYEVAERHEITVAAPRALTYAAALDVDMERAPVVHAIFAGRRILLPHGDTAASQLTIRLLESIGWARLAEAPGREVVFGAVTQPWQGDVRFEPLPAAAFLAFDRPGYVKIVWTLAVDSLGPARSRFRTETRVLATDATSRALFRRYWAALSPGIVLIRWQAIRLVRADAERRWRAAS